MIIFSAPESQLSSQMSLISYQSLNGANSGSRGPREEVKKGKSSKFNSQNYEQVKSSLALKEWLQESSNLHPKNGQKWLNRAKTGVLRGTLKFFPRPGQGVSRV